MTFKAGGVARRMFSEERTLFISRKAGVSDLSSLIGCVKECGFDESSYLTANPDLRKAGLDPASALFHFLAYGVDEHREVPGGTLADGLAGLTALPMTDQAYAIRLFRNLFFGQLENPCTAERLWHAVDGGASARWAESPISLSATATPLPTGGNRRTGRNGWPLCLSCVTAGPRSGSPVTMLDRCTAVKYCDGPGRPRVCHSTSMCRSFSSSAGSMRNSCGFGGESGKARTGFRSTNSMRSLESRSADMGCSSMHSAILSIPNC